MKKWKKKKQPLHVLLFGIYVTNLQQTDLTILSERMKLHTSLNYSRLVARKNQEDKSNFWKHILILFLVLFPSASYFRRYCQTSPIKPYKKKTHNRVLLGKEFAISNDMVGQVKVGQEILYLLLHKLDQTLKHAVSINFSIQMSYFYKKPFTVNIAV